MKEDNKKIDKNDYKPELALIDDISQINNIIVSFWGKNSKYDNKFYYRVLKHNLSYVYKIDNEIIAVCLIEKFERKKEIDIALLCVKKPYQRNGLGKSLLNFCINNCMKQGYYDFFLHVSTTNQIAINLYKKLGFYAIKYVPNYYHTDPPPHNNAFLLKLEKERNNQNDSNIKPFKQNFINDNEKKDDFHNNDKRYFYKHYHYNNKYRNYNYNNNYQYYYHYQNQYNNRYNSTKNIYHNYNTNYNPYNFIDYRDDYWKRYNRWYH
jgi:ribosomal protein S18 acetylase RimI-like enzyme